MPRASYQIIPINKFSYEVRVAEPNTGGRTITGFQSMAEAENWIEIQKRHEPRVGLGPPHGAGERGAKRGAYVARRRKKPRLSGAES